MFQTRAVGDGCFGRAISADKADGLCFAACPIAIDSSPHACDAKVIAHDGNTRLAHVANDLLDAFDLLVLARTVKQDIIPKGWVKVFERSEFKPSIIDRGAQVA